MRKLIYITIVVAAAACSSGVGGDSDGGGTGGNGGGGGAGGGGGSGTTTGLPSTLAGTWDLSGGGSSAVVGTLTLSSTELKVQLGGATFDLQAGATPSLTWTTAHDAPAFTVSHTPVDVGFGALPIAAGGDWMIGGPGGGSCVGSIRADAVSGGCTHAGAPPSPLPSLNRQVHGTRTQKLDSIFGELGGSWNLSDGGNGTCSASFSGATVSVSCKSGTASAGSITVTFSDGLASGFTDSGAEFSARRR